MKNFYLILLLTISINTIAQKANFPNQESFELFKEIERLSEIPIIPEVVWPIKTIDIGGQFITLFKLEGKVEETQFKGRFMEYLVSVEIVSEDNVQYLKIVSIFPPSIEKHLAQAFYSLGVNQVKLDGKIVPVYQYPEAYRAYSHRELRSKRIQK
jgi:hypothetical protein